MVVVSSPDALARELQPGDSIFIGGGLSPASAFIDALQADAGRSAGVQITTSFPQSFSTNLDFEKLHPSVRVTVPQTRREWAAAQADGRLRALPVTFTGFLRHLHGASFDLGVVQVALPDAHGRYSLGLYAEFLPVALRRCRRIAVLVNPALPALPTSSALHANEIDLLCETLSPIPHYINEIDAAADAIGRHLAELVDNNSHLQMGIGKIPAAIAKYLHGHRGLKIHSGMVTDFVRDLHEGGALDPAHDHLATFAAGSSELYQWLPDAPWMRIVGAEEIFDAPRLAGMERFVAVNAALEVDLLGQCNLEHAGSRAISGAGGAPDFARTARMSPGGLSVVALNATFANGSRSRIVPRLGSDAVMSLSGLDIDAVVTEYGTADLRHANVSERAKAIIAVAAPPFRETLAREWRRVSGRR